MAQIIRITSEALQATVRRLLPSQQGFGEDLQASNIITPVIDLTPTAEGSQLPTDLARAQSFGGVTAFSVNNTTSTLANSPGFWALKGTATFSQRLSNGEVKINLTDGLGTKIINEFEAFSTNDVISLALNFEHLIFLDTGESITITANTNGNAFGSYWQVADRYGNVNNPSGFTFE